MPVVQYFKMIIHLAGTFSGIYTV